LNGVPEEMGIGRNFWGLWAVFHKRERNDKDFESILIKRHCDYCYKEAVYF
jgi:hypothetical protein